MQTNLFDPKFLLRRAKRKIVQRYANQYAQGRILDIGCGSASYKTLFLEHVDRYIGLHYPAFSGHIDYGEASFDVAADVRALPLQAECAHSALLLDVLEHVFEVDESLANVARILKPGGTLLLTTPFIYPVHGQPFDFHRFSFFALEQHLARNNLRVVESIVLGYYGAVLAVLLNRFLYLAIWGNHSKLRIIGLPLRPMLLLIFALINLIGLFLDNITSRLPTWVYLENAVICEKSNHLRGSV
ncbi:class I SAM-dependent methyltransferase [Chloroflexota bacterium]